MAKDVRIEPPIPGKSLAAKIEGPTPRLALYLSVNYGTISNKSRKSLEIPLGKAVNKPQELFDLSKMPHLLVAGSTGSGKSVAVNGIIAGILSEADLNKLNLWYRIPRWLSCLLTIILISWFQSLIHAKPARLCKRLWMKWKIVMNSFVVEFKWAAGFNAKVEEFNSSLNSKQIRHHSLSWLDELADLMMVASKEVKMPSSVQQKACCVFTWFQTQRHPLTPFLVWSRPTSISKSLQFQCGLCDSRTIFRWKVTEKPPVEHMLFKPDWCPSSSSPRSFISDDDVERS